MKAKREAEIWDAYCKYQLRWMADHGYSINLLCAYLTDIINENYSEIEDVTDALAAFEETGFNGEIWASFEEFKKNEYQEQEEKHDEA